MDNIVTSFVFQFNPSFYQAPPSMEFSRQENWNGLPFPSPGDLPNPGIEPGSPPLQADALPSELPGKSSFYHPFTNIYYISTVHQALGSGLGLPGRTRGHSELHHVGCHWLGSSLSFVASFSFTMPLMLIQNKQKSTGGEPELRNAYLEYCWGWSWSIAWGWGWGAGHCSYFVL